MRSYERTDNRIKHVPSEHASGNDQLSKLEPNLRIMCILNVEAVETEAGIVIGFAAVHELVAVGERVAKRNQGRLVEVDGVTAQPRKFWKVRRDRQYWYTGRSKGG